MDLPSLTVISDSRYDHEAIIYFGTADRLTAVRDTWLSEPNRMDPARVARFVDDCEHAISTENEAWLAKWIRDHPENTVKPRAELMECPETASVTHSRGGAH